jgi:20S proteasome alpha/beta subunit
MESKSKIFEVGDTVHFMLTGSHADYAGVIAKIILGDLFIITSNHDNMDYLVKKDDLIKWN